MKPVLKGQDCFEHDPIEDWVPSDSAEVDYCLCLHIGPDRSDGAELFYVNIVSPKVAETMVTKAKKLIIEDYSWSAVLTHVTNVLDSIEAPDWTGITDILRVKFNWEFESYRPYIEKAEQFDAPKGRSASW